MSDHSISIVPKLSAYPNKSAKAREILDWLVSIDTIKSQISDCVLGANGGYSISSGAREVTSYPNVLPFEFGVNGLELTTERQIFHTGQNGMDLALCPKCNQNIADEDWGFLSEWGDNLGDTVTCPLCSEATDIHQYKFSPDWGFSDLGFTFWNWPPFTDDFINEFKVRLKCEINIVHTWI
jgi:hypothetical protein